MESAANFQHKTTHENDKKKSLIRSKFAKKSFSTEAIAKTQRKRSSGSLIKMPPETVPPDYYSVFTQKFYLVSSYTLTARSVQTEIHNLHGKCICCCGYLDKHTRLNFYLYEPQKPNIYQGIIVRSGEDSVALWHREKLVGFINAVCPAGRCLQPRGLKHIALK